MRQTVTLKRFDDYIEESRWLEKGNLIFEAFDGTCNIYPLKIDARYLVELELCDFNDTEPEITEQHQGKIEQIGESFAHFLYGYVENNIFRVGEFEFDFSEVDEFGQFEKAFVRYKADRIGVRFIKELSSQSA